ncbi:O-antigen ligase family protein [Polyangium sp. 15x6]|uniref:O-antigen ligase family protein n=1 Tax=Polyangium sp. 15x6 TaxID=3042687 RepID=UPI00249CE637|nr:O-antigen ligase family protein [Polyangium sp. 15x6]MDI3288136.1 O-antigen ligase family protein [Polyangium sp. 15x6]
MRPLAALVAFTVASSALALGGVHVRVVALLAPFAFVAAALALRREQERKGSISLALPAILAIALAAYTLLQAVPLPMAVLERIAPGNADVWSRALLPFGEAGPRFASLSLDPGSTIVEALKWSSYAAIFTASAAVSARRGAATGVTTVFASAVAVALVTVVHGLAGMTKVYGFYAPSVSLPPWHVGPLINPNTLAGYLNLGALAGMGLVLMHEPVLPRWLVASGVAFLVAVDVTSASRGGVIALILGVLLLALLLRVRAARRGGSAGVTDPSLRFLLGGALVGGAALALLGGTRDTWFELYDKNIDKLQMVLWALPVLREHPIFGIGRGAFESVFPAYRESSGHVVFAYVENFPAQWLVEWGAPVALVALALFAWALAPSRLGALRSRLAASAFTGVVVVLLQNLADLSLEIPAVCFALATVLGSLWGDRARSRPSRGLAAKAPGKLARLAPTLTLLVGLALAAASFGFGHPDVGAERDAIRKTYDATNPADPAAHDALKGALRVAMRRHPAEPYFPLIGALAAYQGKRESALPWLQRTLERGHVNGRAHLLLAQVLASRGARRQALLELRIAVTQDGSLVGPAGVFAARISKEFDELLGAVPEGKAGAPMLDELAVQTRNLGNAALSARLDAEAITRNPGANGPRVRAANALLDALAKGTCDDRARCAREIEAHAAALEAAFPGDFVADRIRAERLVTEGKSEDAEARLAARCARVTDRVGCLRARVEIASRVPGVARIDAASKDLLAATCLSASACAETASFLARIREGRGDSGSALTLHARAAREEPTEARWLALADAASRSGAHAQAADALERAAQKRGMTEELRKRIAEERAKALGGP